MVIEEPRLTREVERVLREAGILDSTHSLLVAVSGGPDSLALLHLLNGLASQHPISLHIAHLDHGLRGAEAEEDARYVSAMAERLDIPVTVEAADVPSFRLEKRLSWEAAARSVRYTFLSRTAERVGADAVALGHTADDQAETVLLHLMRGSGLQGLRGMLPHTLRSSRDQAQMIPLLRPLLRVTRGETEAYCRALGLIPRRDPSNLKEQYTRNRIRHKLLPALSEYNPSIQEALTRLSRTVARDLDFIDEQLHKVWPTIVTAEPWGVRISRDDFLALHLSMQAHLLRRVWEELAGDTSGLSSNHVEAMLDLAQDEGVGKTLSLGRGIRFQTDYEQLVLDKRPPSWPPPQMSSYTLPIPGRISIEGWHITTRFLQGELRLETGDAYRAYLDAAPLGGQVQIRARKAGDWFQPLGMKGTKKLNDFMIDARIPKYWRDRVPILVSERGLAWVVGWRIAHWARVTKATRKVIEVIFTREECSPL